VLFHRNYSQGLGGFYRENPGAVFELIGHVEIGVVARSRLPHFPQDLQPALTQAAER
jgi:hypothetical protein